MLTRRETLRAVTALACLTPENARQQPPSQDGDLRKFDSALAFIRSRAAQDYAMATDTAVDQAKYVRIGGLDQWITIRGENRANPVILLLHGGPGDATNPWGHAGFRLWLRNYTLVQWDQRGAARTLSRNGRSSADSVSIDRLVHDGLELADALRSSLGRKQIILAGHSFGSIIGVLMAKSKPELFQAFVGTGQVGDPARAYTVAFEALLATARARRDARALRELQEIGPPPYKNGRGYQVQRRWSNLFEGADAFIASMLGFALTAPGYTVGDINDWFDGQGLSAERLVPESSAMSAAALSGRFSLPVFVIQGAEDFTTPTSLARRFVDSIQAPRKAFVTINGGHFAAFMDSPAFLEQFDKLVAGSAR